jgi:zinc protease
MNIKNNFKKITILGLVLFITAGISLSQTVKFPEPRQEKLLNELKLLIWNVPSAEKVTVKLRFHKGSAFDRQEKEGTMALVANILFPGEVPKDFFEQDLGGSLEIISNYDYIQINATADSDKILDVLQTLSNALLNPEINKETTELVRQAQIEKVKNLENDPVYVANRAIAKRFFGDFPYGRPEMGTLESLQKIDFADLMFAKNKFLTSDNATIAVIGNVKSDLVYRAARRYFGGWVKADEKIPATFRLPDAPDSKLQILEANKENTSEIRFAIRGVARNDKDYYAAEILENILEKRLQKQQRGKVFISGEGNLLPGLITFGVNDWNLGTVKKQENQISLPMDLDKTVSNLFKETLTAEEFNSAKTQVLSKFNADKVSDFWLDVETYRLKSFKDDYNSAQNVTLEDVKKVAEKFKNEPVASVLLFQNPKTAEMPKTSDN